MREVCLSVLVAGYNQFIVHGCRCDTLTECLPKAVAITAELRNKIDHLDEGVSTEGVQPALLHSEALDVAVCRVGWRSVHKVQSSL